MAQGNRSSFMGLSVLFYLFLLFSPLALISQVHAESDQDPLQDNYGTGRRQSVCEGRRRKASANVSELQLSVLIWEPPTLA